ncbi:FecR family protein [Polaribacter sp.]|uniref:FecR family protein n=1 Tax=Polaribacter sp. TaxID=1920175 RepID=UPI003F6D24F2
MAEKTTFNDTYLAKWIADEITDNQLKELVSDKDYKAYKNLKIGVHAFEYLEAPYNATLTSIKDKIAAKKPVKKGTKVKSLFAKSMMAVAASIALFFSVSTFLDFSDVTVESDYGEIKTVALLDNSQVVLNAKSNLSYNKKDWKNKRNVNLQGEAYFKVQKGSTFNVITENGIISVLGTQFNVNSQKDFFEVTCFEGKVKVTSGNKIYILTPNKSVRILKGIDTEKTLNLTNTEPNWVLGESDFRSVPLSIVINALEKQFNITIKSNTIDTSIIFTGSFDNKNLKVALASVFKTTNIKYQVKNDTIILSN